MTPLPWSAAWRSAAREFWSRSHPTEHFSTSAGDLLADRLAEVVCATDLRLGSREDFTVIDIGGADGALLSKVRHRCGQLAERARWVVVDVRAGFVPDVEGLVAEVPGPLPIAPLRGVVMAHEWLDEIPVDIVQRDSVGIDRLVLVDSRGNEVLGPSLDDPSACASLGVDAEATRHWIEEWWPLREPGDRAEVGCARDAAWAWLTGLVAAGVALAVDYGHDRVQRTQGLRSGTLVGYRDGHVVAPVPDGSVGITAHVAWDSCAAAVPGTVVTRQRDEVAAAPLRPSASASEIERFFAARRLRQPSGLGSFAWLRWEA